MTQPTWTKKPGSFKERTKAGNIRWLRKAVDEETGIHRETVSILTPDYIPTGKTKHWYYHPSDDEEHETFDAARESIQD